jgi:uncharacterized protein
VSIAASKSATGASTAGASGLQWGAIYQWDIKKAAENLRKHDVSFEEANTLFLDPFVETFDDPDHSDDERRFITLGMSTSRRLLFVAHANSGEDRVRSSVRRQLRAVNHAHQERSGKQR